MGSSSDHMGCTHKVIAVIIPALTSDSHLKLIVTSFTRGLQEVFWEKLTLFIEIVTSSLRQVILNGDVGGLTKALYSHNRLKCGRVLYILK
jgi:hypothetical protein